MKAGGKQGCSAVPPKRQLTFKDLHGVPSQKIEVACMWRLYKMGIGLTTGFIGSHTVTHNYSVYTS
jgi:hypothetical protein